VEAVEANSRWSFRHFVPVAAPALIGVLFLLLGHTTRAVVLWVIAGITLVLVLAGVPVDRYLARFAAAIADGVGALASFVIGAILVVAGWVLKLFGADPLTPRARRGNGWQPAPASVETDRLASATFGIERLGAVSATQRSGPLRWAFMSLGVVAALLLVDVGLGMTWERLSRSDTAAGEFVDAINLTGNTSTVADPRADGAAMAAYPWAKEYFREVQLTPSTYWPFTESRPQAFEGEFVTIGNWARASYVSPDASADAPVVWMFGGSTTWGEGQRDEHTIASYLSRIAESEGVPIVIKNYGQRGWTHFQEMILFEQLLAEGPVPDLAIFYDGANEINAQTLGAKGVPTHTLADQYAEKISGGIAEEFRPPPPPPPSAWSVAWDAYVSQSAIHKAARRAREFVDPPAGAVEIDQVAVQDDDGAGTSGSGQIYEKTVEDAERAVDVYERGRGLTLSLAEQYDVGTLFLWQPVLGSEPEAWSNENMSEPTVDISDALDDDTQVYIDGGHTNEEGARIVAERIWIELEPTVRAFYEED